MGVNMQFLAAVHGRAARAALGEKKAARTKTTRRISNGDRKKNPREQEEMQTDGGREDVGVLRTDGGMHMSPQKRTDNERETC